MTQALPSKVPTVATEVTDEQLDREAQQAVDDLKWLMRQASGRRFMWRLFEMAGVYRTSFHHSGSVTAFNEGQRNVGLQFLGEVQEHAPEAFLLMLKERKT